MPVKPKPRRKKQDKLRDGAMQTPNHVKGEVSHQSGAYECSKNLIDCSMINAVYQSGILRITIHFADEYTVTLTHIIFLEKDEELADIVAKIRVYTDIVGIDGAYLLKYKNSKGVNINLVTGEARKYKDNDGLLASWMRGENLEHLLRMGVVKQN
jgi:hypothetical protein